MSKRHVAFTENFTIFSSNAGKTDNMLEFVFERFWIIFGRLYTCNIYVIATRVSEFTQLYICYKFYSKKLSDP